MKKNHLHRLGLECKVVALAREKAKAQIVSSMECHFKAFNVLFYCEMLGFEYDTNIC